MESPSLAGKILVVGATGKLGMAVVQHLSDHNASVVALARDPLSPRAKDLARMHNVEIAKGDVLDEDSLRAAVRGCEGVVGAWGCVRVSRVTDLLADPAALPAHPASVLLGGTKRLVRACQAHAVSRLVLFSCLPAAYSPWNPFALALATLLSLLPKWQRASEDCVRASGLPYTIIRPARLTAAPPASLTDDKLVLVSDGQEAFEVSEGHLSAGTASQPEPTTPALPPLNGISTADVAALCALCLVDSRTVGATLRVARATPPTADNNYAQEPAARERWEDLLHTVCKDRGQLGMVRYRLAVAAGAGLLVCLAASLAALALRALRLSLPA